MIGCELRRCVGCRMCELACSWFHSGAVSPALSRIRVSKLEEVGIDMAVACLGCLEKACLVCPTDALSLGSRGEILLDADLCDGCEECAGACPIGAVGFHDGVPLFCDLCDGLASCISVCPTDALFHQKEGEVSLAVFQDYRGSAGQKRAHFTGVRAAPVREEWREGRRVDA
jgi:Fe-S-cluster-containing hydrogenase component 2